MESPTRLNKYLALHLGISRREADDHIAHGRVAVNNSAAELGARISEQDRITIDGKPLNSRKIALTYLALNKPKGYVCSRRQQGETPTIYELLPTSLHHLKPIGRLDKDSSGLLLLSNDGDFAHRLTHPSFHKKKTYEIVLNKPLEPLHQQMISDHGIALEDGVSKLLLEHMDKTRRTWRVSMHEGRNRQIRRTFAALGYDVTMLHRTMFGNYTLASLKSGAYKEIQP